MSDSLDEMVRKIRKSPDTEAAKNAAAAIAIILLAGSGMPADQALNILGNMTTETLSKVSAL